MEKQKEIISLICSVDNSNVKTDKSKEDSIVLTKLSGLAEQTMFSKLSKEMEHTVFGTRFWKTIATGQLTGSYIFELKDVKTGELVCTIKGCSIENVKLKINKEDGVDVAFMLRHEKTAYQNALSAAVSKTFLLSLIMDETVMEESENEFPESEA